MFKQESPWNIFLITGVWILYQLRNPWLCEAPHLDIYGWNVLREFSDQTLTACDSCRLFPPAVTAVITAALSVKNLCCQSVNDLSPGEVEMMTKKLHQLKCIHGFYLTFDQLINQIINNWSWSGRCPHLLTFSKFLPNVSASSGTVGEEMRLLLINRWLQHFLGRETWTENDNIEGRSSTFGDWTALY